MAACTVPECKREAKSDWLCELHKAHIDAHDSLAESENAVRIIEQLTDLAVEYANDTLTKAMVNARDNLKVRRGVDRERVLAAGEALK